MTDQAAELTNEEVAELESLPPATAKGEVTPPADTDAVPAKRGRKSKAAATADDAPAANGASDAAATGEQGSQTVVRVPDYQITPVGVDLPKKLEFEAWLEIGRDLATRLQGWQLQGSSIQWQIGHWMAYGEDMYGEQAAQGEAIFEAVLQARSPRTIYNWSSVAHQYKLNERYSPDVLSFTHHKEVAYLADANGKGHKMRQALLQRAVDEKLSAGDLRQIVKQLNAGDEPGDDDDDYDGDSDDAADIDDDQDEIEVLATIRAKIVGDVLAPMDESDVKKLKSIARKYPRAEFVVEIQRFPDAEEGETDYGPELVKGKAGK